MKTSAGDSWNIVWKSCSSISRLLSKRQHVKRQALRLHGKGEWPDQDWPSSSHRQGNKYGNKPYWTQQPSPATSWIPRVTVQCGTEKSSNGTLSFWSMKSWDIIKWCLFLATTCWGSFSYSIRLLDTWRCSQWSKLHPCLWVPLPASHLSPGGLRIFLSCIFLSGPSWLLSTLDDSAFSI